MFPRALENSAAGIAAILDRLTNDLAAAKDDLKIARDRRAALAFDAPKADVEVQNETIRRLEDSILALQAQLNEGGQRHTAALAAEAVADDPAYWNKTRDELLGIDEHLRAIEAAWNRLSEMRAARKVRVRAVHQIGGRDSLLVAPLELAVRRYRESTFDPEAVHSASRDAARVAVNELVQDSAIKAGPRYSESPVAQVFDLLRGMAPEDARRPRKAA